MSPVDLLDRPQRRVLVTGGSSGIGASVVERLAADGYIVDLIYNDTRADGMRAVAHAWRCDLSSEASRQALIDEIASLGLEYYAIVHCAGASYDSLIASVSLDRARKIMDVNFWAVVSLVREIAPGMLRRRNGRIVVISSVAAEKGARGNSIYGATKAALNGFVRNIAVEFAPRGVTVNSVLPGYIETRMLSGYSDMQGRVEQVVPLKRLGVPSEISGLVAFLLSDDAAYITGAMLSVDGGVGARV